MREYPGPLVLGLLGIPVAIVFVVLGVWLVLVTNVGPATIVRNGDGPFTALINCSRRFFSKGQRRRSFAVAICASLPWMFTQAIYYYLYFHVSVAFKIWEQIAILAISVPAMLYALSICMTYDEDLRDRIEGADIFAVVKPRLQ